MGEDVKQTIIDTLSRGFISCSNSRGSLTPRGGGEENRFGDPESAGGRFIDCAR